MRFLLTILLTLALASTALAVDLGNTRPAKPDVTYEVPAPDPARQGGDTFDDATPIDLPYAGTGTTAGFVDNYDEVCPFDSMSPEVVYVTTPPVDMVVVIDLLGSTYDTKVYVYDENFYLVACNDDFYPDYVSKIEEVALTGGAMYYIVIDGYGGDSGDYVLTITEYVPCIIDCPAGAELEGEPPLVDGYVDDYNGGCNSDGVPPFGQINTLLFCGTSGWYSSPHGDQYRDTDWYELVMPADGYLEILGDAEEPTYMFELGPQDCDNVAVIQQATIGPCQENSMTIYGAPGSTVWFWVGPTTFEEYTAEYDYVLVFGCIYATENQSWSSVKSLFE